MNEAGGSESEGCRAASNRTIPCAGRLVKSEDCCLRHACLFDIWICEHGGNKVYGFKGSTRAEDDEPTLRRWKRAQFHAWLDTLTISWVEAALSS